MLPELSAHLGKAGHAHAKSWTPSFLAVTGESARRLVPGEASARRATCGFLRTLHRTYDEGLRRSNDSRREARRIR